MHGISSSPIHQLTLHILLSVVVRSLPHSQPDDQLGFFPEMRVTQPRRPMKGEEGNVSRDPFLLFSI